jgi:hypothetical protein
MRNLLQMRIAHANLLRIRAAGESIPSAAHRMHCHLSSSDDWVVLESASRLCTYAPRSATRTRAAPSTCTSGRRPAVIRRSMVRTETPSCSAASLLVISSRPDTVEGSNAARKRVKRWHGLTFPDTSWEKSRRFLERRARCAVDLEIRRVEVVGQMLPGWCRCCGRSRRHRKWSACRTWCSRGRRRRRHPRLCNRHTSWGG